MCVRAREARVGSCSRRIRVVAAAAAEVDVCMRGKLSCGGSTDLLAYILPMFDTQTHRLVVMVLVLY